ncbi:MAG: DNA-3-methyladenine glycosylase I [Pseudomonadota bacterium]
MTIDDPTQRCPWPGISDPEYTRYHDEEWGVPVDDDRRLFEKLILEGFQSGLSWLTILKKRPAFRSAFDNFDATRIARYDDADVARLMSDTGIVRNRAKIEATITNARAFLDLSSKTRLAHLVWGLVDGKPIIHERRDFSEIPAQTDLSQNLSKQLKAHGFRFVGPTTAYAFLQSVGVVNDHIITCHRHAPCADLQRAFRID